MGASFSMAKRSVSTRAKLLEVNFEFYTGVGVSKPGNHTVKDIHKWKGDYNRLEENHSYIQWLFPLFEGNGVNYQAYRLEKEEARKMRMDRTVGVNLVRSYQLMLHFYGMRLADRTGKVERNPDNWVKQYKNLNQRFHNNLRISRILSCLSHLGFEKLKFAWLDFLEDEIMNNKELRNCKSSLLGHWLPLRNVDSAAYKSKTLEEPEDRIVHEYFDSIMEELFPEQDGNESMEENSEENENSADNTPAKVEDAMEMEKQ